MRRSILSLALAGTLPLTACAVEPWEQQNLRPLEVDLEIGEAERQGRPQPLVAELVYHADVLLPGADPGAGCPRVYERHARVPGAGCPQAPAARPQVQVVSKPVPCAAVADGANRWKAAISPEDRYWAQYWSACEGCVGVEWIEVRLAGANGGAHDSFCTGARGAVEGDRLDLRVLPGCDQRFTRPVPAITLPPL